MGYTVLERILVPERRRPRSGRTGFAIPALEETSVSETSGPYLATNMRGMFVAPRRSTAGMVRYGFSPCTVEEEPLLLRELVRVLSSSPKNRCESLPEAIRRTVNPKFLTLSEPTLRKIVGPTYDSEVFRKSMSQQGSVTVVEGMQVLLADLPEDTALVSTSPADLGMYTRIRDYVGLLLQHVDRAIMVVERGVA